MTDASQKVETLRVADGEADMRLDRWFRVHFPEVGYTYLQKLLRSGQVRIDSKRAQANDRLNAGAEIRVPAIVRQPKKSGTACKLRPGVSKGDRDAIEKMILFEDDHVLVLNKPFGLAVQGGSGTRKHIDGMLEGMADRFGGERPRLVHRLDRDTTGRAARRENARRGGQTRAHLSNALGGEDLLGARQGRAEAAAGQGRGRARQGVRPRRRPRAQGQAGRAGGRDARDDTLFPSSIAPRTRPPWVSLKPVTGRQHQLRAHMHLIGHPIVGDNKYEGDIHMPAENIEKKLHLHARRLVIPIPRAARRSTSRRHCRINMHRTWELLGFDEDKFEERDAPP